MATAAARRTLADKNQILKSEHSRLRNKKEELSLQLSTVIRRCKQMSKLNQALQQELEAATQATNKQRQQSASLMARMADELRSLQEQYQVQCLHFKKLQGEYDVCMKDYDEVLGGATEEAARCATLEAEIEGERNTGESMQAMIFDYQRLKRVLEEEKNYFKELSCSEEKSHDERLKQLETILRKLTEDSYASETSLKQRKMRAGFSRLALVFQQRRKSYAQVLIRRWLHQRKRGELGVKVFSNCMLLAKMKQTQVAKQYFTRWHDNAFDKAVLRGLVQSVARRDAEMRVKMVTLNKISAQMYDRSMEVFQMYEKAKYIAILTTKIARKDMHYGFARWRNEYSRKDRQMATLSRLFNKNIPSREKRCAFGLWRTETAAQNRAILATNLRSDYDTSKQLAWAFRKWRLEVPRRGMDVVRELLYRMRMRSKVECKIAYEKRKSRILTGLALKMTDIQLRSYFFRYWANAKDRKMDQNNRSIQNLQAQFSEYRAEHKSLEASTERGQKKHSLKVFRVFMLNSRLRPALKKWHNTCSFLRQRSHAVRKLALKKDNASKFMAMNELRRFVQAQHKAEMHAVLTDLNNKMECINEQSTLQREKLKQCINRLALVASKRIDAAYRHVVAGQQQAFFNSELRQQIQRVYWGCCLNRLVGVLQGYFCKQGINLMLTNSKTKRRTQWVEQTVSKLLAKKKQNKKVQIFYALRGLTRTHRECMQKLTHIESALQTNKLSWAFACIQAKCNEEISKYMSKEIASYQMTLSSKKVAQHHLQEQKQEAQQKLQALFEKFVQFEDRDMRIKEANRQQQIKSRYFNRFRGNARGLGLVKQMLAQLGLFIQHKNMAIFWRGITALSHEQEMEQVREELGKLNRRKKLFQEKSGKGSQDLARKVSQAQQQHAEKQSYHEHFENKLGSTLESTCRRQEIRKNRRYMQAVFKTWKHEYLGTKRLATSINKVLLSHLVSLAYLKMVQTLNSYRKVWKREHMLGELLQRNNRNMIKNCIQAWNCNILKLQTEETTNRSLQLAAIKKQHLIDCRMQVSLLVGERVRAQRLATLAGCFMAMKAGWTYKQHVQRSVVGPHRSKWDIALMNRILTALRWRIYYKKTKKAFIHHKSEQTRLRIMAAVFLHIKKSRRNLLTLVSRLQTLSNTKVTEYAATAFNKIVNLAAFAEGEAQCRKKRLLRQIMYRKLGQCSLAKRRLLAKWHAWCIPRQHQLLNCLQTVWRRVLLQPFCRVRQFALWNPLYIKEQTDKIVKEGFADINNLTTNLVRENYHPQQVETFLVGKNMQDKLIIGKVIGRLAAWGPKQNMVRAWNSWVQYRNMRIEARTVLGRALKIAGGMGRYWKRWRSKDRAFNQILNKESRGSMLQRYNQLTRLLKSFKKDVADSQQYCGELAQINSEYSAKNDASLRLALSALSQNIKKGLKQGLELWRQHSREQQKLAMDARYEKLGQGIEAKLQQRNRLKYRISLLKDENGQMREKCGLGQQCGRILERLLKERDNLSINLADKEHNLKLLLQDNLRLKQKIASAKQNAEKLISQVQLMEQST